VLSDSALGQGPPGRLAAPPTKAPDSSAPAEIRIEGTRAAAPAHIDPVERFDAKFVDRTDAFTADEVLAQLSASLPGTQQLILIDGHETTEDISTIPAGRIDRIEVSTTGVMPDGRPRFPGNVINIILRQEYNGASLGGRRRDSQAGGGGQTQLSAFGGYTLDRLSGTLNFVHREQDALLAGERDFSRSQNHVGLGGSDYREPYGASPVVQAVTGSLNGITDVSGAPVSIALAPEPPLSRPLAPSDFIPAPAGTTAAAGLRHFNPSDFLYLVAPAHSNVGKGDLTYALTQTTKLHAGYTFTRSESQQLGPPPITPVGNGSVVPAAYNPFGQDIEVGLVDSGFGGVRRETSADRSSGYFCADGRFATTWTWSGRVDLGHRESNSQTRDLDPIAFAEALGAADPSVRFNPFAQTGPGSANAALYPSLINFRRSAGSSDDTRLRANTQGELSRGWVEPIVLRADINQSINDSRQDIDPGASIGPEVDTRTRLNSSRLHAALDIPAFRVRELESPAVLTVSTYLTRDRETFNPSDAAPRDLEVNTLAWAGLLNIPWTVPADARRYAYQLETRSGVGMVHSGGQTKLTAEAGALWSPSEPFTLRADYSRQQSPTPITLYPLTVEYGQTLIDRRRADSVAGNVEVISSQPDAQPPPLVTRFVVFGAMGSSWSGKPAAEAAVCRRGAERPAESVFRAGHSGQRGRAGRPCDPISTECG
jgi:hypothetical protein